MPLYGGMLSGAKHRVYVSGAAATPGYGARSCPRQPVQGAFGIKEASKGYSISPLVPEAGSLPDTATKEKLAEATLWAALH